MRKIKSQNFMTKIALSEQVKKLPASATLAMAAKARELKSLGKNIISLSLGEPDFDTPDFIKEAAKNAISENYSSYPPVDGYADLKESICRKFKRDNLLDYAPNQIVVSTGAKQSIANIFMALLNPGDEVLSPAPFWVSYEAIASLVNAKFVSIPSSFDTDFKISPEQLEAAITPKTKLLVLNSPNNPSGSVYSKEEYYALAEVLKKYPDIFILSDEIYEHILYPNASLISFAAIPEMFDRTITVNGVAKAFAMTGWRIGYMGAPEWIAKACTKIQGQITSGANSIAQRATLAALDASPQKIHYMVEEFQKRKDLIVSEISKIEGFKVNNPQGAFYIFPDISYFFGKTIQNTLIKNADDFAMFLLEKAHIATVSGAAFGNPNCLRISYAASVEEIKTAIERIKNALSE